MRILVAEDEPTTASLLRGVLTRSGHAVEVVADGRIALERMQRSYYDALLTDWIMPDMDGMTLIREVRRALEPAPLIVMVTSVESEEGRSQAMLAGADEYVEKPVAAHALLHAIEAGVARVQPAAGALRAAPTDDGLPAAVHPPHVALAVAASTGGPEALQAFFRALPAHPALSCHVVQHGPEWMLQAVARRLRRTGHKVHYVRGRSACRPGRIHLAPAARHLRVVAGQRYMVQPTDGAMENFVVPSADPLFRSVSDAFGSKCIAVVLTGTGRDGAAGAVRVAERGGVVLAQDPETALAGAMPRAAIGTGAVSEVQPLELLAARVARHVERLWG